MRGGVCHLIFSLSTAKVKLDNQLLLQFFNTLLENFKHPNQEVQDEAARAFEVFCETYFQKSNDGNQDDQIQEEESSSLLI